VPIINQVDDSNDLIDSIDNNLPPPVVSGGAAVTVTEITRQIDGSGLTCTQFNSEPYLDAINQYELGEYLAALGGQAVIIISVSTVFPTCDGPNNIEYMTEIISEPLTTANKLALNQLGGPQTGSSISVGMTALAVSDGSAYTEDFTRAEIAAAPNPGDILVTELCPTSGKASKKGKKGSGQPKRCKGKKGVKKKGKVSKKKSKKSRKGATAQLASSVGVESPGAAVALSFGVFATVIFAVTKLRKTVLGESEPFFDEAAGGESAGILPTEGFIAGYGASSSSPAKEHVTALRH